MYLLDPNSIEFPNPTLANEDDVLAIGGDLSTERLLAAYQKGIFPWYSDGEPIIWYSPAWRMVLDPRHYKPSKSLKQLLKKNTFTVTFNQHFKEVIYNCKTINRDDGLGTWITDDMQQAYIKLHELGVAKSIEVWHNDELVGGLYGIDQQHVFCGESMFSKVSNASKIAFAWLNNYLVENNYDLLDCQVHNEHLESLGAYEIPRQEFLDILTKKKL
ncbi:leucyl/phenylalanyl-tRNA--protein transferase [Wenyingzhuangia marina]|uniref:Leucyl/phenylalanyl-tRNA--protein transferase n=1 Tax=Wenyingzhuangia marina TaxID=1195760 RepID=A0A1M5TB35_9FLAO|nr:leucyl/phenylalanyl-tRNA--protein transferase [Wenyingzhuangia marina]GGF66119.1 leucyl/phenylalanyl-tRNA--protein transferase [Wenyingzhuangia marina]SHH47898.1 leucyl/phenylalanyl-tRNA--protein transferase [Wenyingzhuangia marina]